jgi:hypothetical protein
LRVTSRGLGDVYKRQAWFILSINGTAAHLNTWGKWAIRNKPVCARVSF